MAREKKVSHLSIFLIKSRHRSVDEILNVGDCAAPIDVPISDYSAGKLFIKRTALTPPKWSDLFRKYLDVRALAVHGVSAAFFIELADRCFVLTFGHGGRFLLRDDVAEERFGLICALNGVDPKTFRCVDVQSLDAIDSHTRIQSGQETTPDQFGLNVEQDMLKAIVGAPKQATLGNRMAGSDALSVSVNLDLTDLPSLLNSYRELFEKKLSAQHYEWVDNITLVKSGTTESALEAQLNARLGNDDFKGIWLSIPEIIEWTDVKGFMYTRGDRLIHPDINMQGFRGTVGGTITIELLRRRRVFCADADHNPTFKSWSIYQCLYAEIELKDEMYILNSGKWFAVAKDFVRRTDREYGEIPLSRLELPEYSGGGEGAYNKKVAESDPVKFDLLDDKKKVMHGGGHGQVEICDLLTIDRELIHVKMYGKSSVLSHLFAQGLVSGQLIQIDGEFREKVKAQLSPSHKALIDASERPSPESFTIIYAIISDQPGGELRLPFFSRVNLNNTRKILRGYGFKVELLKISANDEYAKTVKVPPMRRRRGQA